MGESNGTWGEVIAHDDDMAEVWDSLTPLPEAGVNPALDAFCETKNIAISDLVRLGARLSDYSVLAYGGPGYLKFRDMVSGRRWSYAGCDWSKLKIIRAGVEPSRMVLVVEGETDAARCSSEYDCDVAVMAAGAMYFPAGYATRLADYEVVLVGLDNDAAGDSGAAPILEALPQAVRFAPPADANDWCSVDGPLPALPDPDAIAAPAEKQVLVCAGDLLDLEPPQVVSWFERGLLPIGGQMVIHGWAKSYKSFLAIDILGALAQGQDWCQFEPTEEPARVAVMQYEIPWPYYQQRIRYLLEHAREPELFRQNFVTWTPLQRPKYRAGDKDYEDYILKSLQNEGIEVFLLDPVRRATGNADLNSEKEVRPLLSFFERLQDAGITVVTVHHDNKSASRNGGGDPLGMTGVGAFAGDCDTIVSVAIPKGNTVDDPTRNLHFTTRNAPHISSRGMEMSPEGVLVYASEPYGLGLEGDESGPAI